MDPSDINAVNNRHRYQSSCGRFIYHIAIIDYLQEWNWEKWGESFYKVQILRRNGALTSAIEPNFYAERFNRFMSTEVFIDSLIFDKNIEGAKLMREISARRSFKSGDKHEFNNDP